MSKGKSSDLEKAMKDKIAGKDECVQVMVRCRPLSSTEKTNKNTKIVDLDRKARSISVRNPTSSEEAPKVFTFDSVFDESCTQKSIYEDGARGIIESVMGGYNGTIFAYGQTGTGKTFTMEGAEPEELKGIIPRSFEHIFQQIDQSADTQFLVRASFLEIYNDDVLDLLGDDPTVKLELKENPDSGVYVKNLQSFVMKGVAEINELLQNGKKNRKTGSTLMNKDSSRSHCIFTVTVETSAAAADGEQHIRVGKLNMVDLAGSERQSKTGAAGSTLKEATKINLSLSALGNVISALTNPKIAHVPYRDSKLTRLLQDSLGGNTKTVMIANLGPADYNFDETISTLRFASRAKAIKNKPKINEDPKDAMLREFQDEIARLKAMLEAEDGGIPPEGMASPSGLRGAAPSDGSAQHFAKQKIIVNKVIQKVVQKGISPEELRKLEEDAAARKRDLEAKHEKEKNEILNLKQQLESKSETTQKELQQKEEILEKQKQDRLALKQKLKAVEAKLLLGNKILDNAQKEAMRLEKNKRELERQKQERERVEAELRAKEEAQLELADKYETLDKNVAEKTAKLNKLRDKYAEIKKEVEDVQAENQKEREELLETIRELTRHIQLKDMILDNFVPREEHEKVENRAYWDEERDEWLLHETDFAALNSEIRRPISARAPPGAAQAVAAAQMSGGVVGTIDGIETGSLLLSRIRPQSEFARLKATVGQDPNPRFRIDNIIDLELDMPERTTQDYHELQMQLSQQNAGMGGHQEDDYMYGADPYGGGHYDRPRTAARGGGRPQSRFS